MPRQWFLGANNEILLASARQYLALARGEDPMDINFRTYLDAAAKNLRAAEFRGIDTHELRINLERYRQQLSY